MKKLLVAGAFALALVAGSQQSASAWSHFKFGVGLNVDWSCGNNNLLWGVYRCGPTPEYGGPGGYAPAPAQFGYPSQPGFYAPAPTPAHGQNTPPASQLAAYPASNYYQANYTQPAGYYPMSYYQPSNYYYPNYTYGYPYGFSFYGN
jgi:hypothetical protein